MHVDIPKHTGAIPRTFRGCFERSWQRWVLAFVLGLSVAIGYGIAFSPPADFPVGSIVSIAPGASAPSVATQLATAHIIKHPRVLRALLRVAGASDRLQAGAYLFSTPTDVFVVAYRLVTGDYGIPPARITFPEGETARDYAVRVHEAFPDISESSFLSLAKPYEGYLFPDTYVFSPSADAGSIVQTMRTNFNTKTASLMGDAGASGHSLSDIITLASLVEKEARSVENKRIVAGVLWNRLKLGMPLQVDAVFGYIFDRDTYSPSLADLKAESPYNTYTHKGLPPGPISNPGLESIDAVIHPTKTTYLYYLTGKDNQMHYATTFAEHQTNRQKYLP
ncbi:MAG: endolytic transglycosylase MltG [Candidatus Pacebacteria bacterium]|nr:endolytic transglycosylase MltG [Candidatus Paceibacterota bacterium]